MFPIPDNLPEDMQTSKTTISCLRCHSKPCICPPKTTICCLHCHKQPCTCKHCSCPDGPMPYVKNNAWYCNICGRSLSTSQLKDMIDSKPKSESLAPGVEQVPFEGIEAIGAIFEEGQIKYGRDNWKKEPGNEEYNDERTRHALRHLTLWANGDRSEPHLAKVGWFVVTTIWREKHATLQPPQTSDSQVILPKSYE